MATAVQSVVMTGQDTHLTPAQVAAYVDRTVDGDARRRVENHLASCIECRAEIADASRIVATLPGRRRIPVWISATAAAALVIMMVWPARNEVPRVAHREAPVTATLSPIALQPVGLVDSAAILMWTSVPHADRYQVRVFAGDGSVLLEREITDTALVLPTSSGLQSGLTYYWKVVAETGFDRSVTSELIAFSVRHPARR